ncbi:MAG: hypothetical protein QGG50_06980 [Methanopyri archaeon]|jgi:hypothetical protein|nr:hypothetical protein [Methanopyri archaeon]
MTGKTSDTVQSIPMGDTFRVCPTCGYEDGFHSFFERIKGSDELAWRFICPQCHARFDLGMRVPAPGP